MLLPLLAAAPAMVGCQTGAQAVVAHPPWDSILTPAPFTHPPPPTIFPPVTIQAPPLAPATPLILPPEWTPVAFERPWRYIVVHHSASESGCADSFDEDHRRRGWDELGYHFVIDNGHGGPDGRVEVGPRWPKQKWGAHCKTPDNCYNNFGIGVCLVGNFENRMPSPGQLASLRRLVLTLAARYHIEPSAVIGHRDAPHAATQCPGDVLHQYIHGPLQMDLARTIPLTARR